MHRIQAPFIGFVILIRPSNLPPKKGQMESRLKRYVRNEEWAGKLQKANILSMEDFFYLFPEDIVLLLDVPLVDALLLRQRVYQSVAPSITSTIHLLHDWSHSLLPVQPPSLQLFLGGGLPFGQITELVGKGGVGKTQLLHYFVCQALLQRTPVYIIDVERSFSPQRCIQFLAAENTPPEAAKALLADIPIYQPSDTHELVRLLQGPLHPSSVAMRSVIIIDSIAALIRKEADPAVIRKAAHIAMLHNLASQCRACILVSNQITTHLNLVQSATTPAMGIKWAHGVHQRVEMAVEGDVRSLTLTKSPANPHATLTWSITPTTCQFPLTLA